MPKLSIHFSPPCGTDEQHDQDRIDDDEAQRERREAVRQRRRDRGELDVLGRRMERAALAPRFDDQRADEPRGRDDRDDREQQRKTRFELELVAHVLHGLEADQRQEQGEADQRGKRCVFQRARDIDARGRARDSGRRRHGHVDPLPPAEFIIGRRCAPTRWRATSPLRGRRGESCARPSTPSPLRAGRAGPAAGRSA